MLPCSSSSDIDKNNCGATGQGNCYLGRRGGVRIERGMGGIRWGAGNVWAVNTQKFVLQ